MNREQKLDANAIQAAFDAADKVSPTGKAHAPCIIAAVMAYLAAAPAPKAAAEEPCPVCTKPFAAGDTCATDIELGKCHAECLAGSPAVDLKTGEPVDGPIDTFPHVAPKAAAVTVKQIRWDKHTDIDEWYSKDAGDWGVSDYVVDKNPVGDDWRLRVRGHLLEDEFVSPAEAMDAAQRDHEIRVLDSVPTSPVPVPALTDEAVERALAEWSKPNDKREPAEIMRAALLAAFPSKGEGE
ncbi:hypothetical protein ACFPOD_05130 [Nitratireductor kimnyeongensis]|uniref:Restriction alleviation protein Lar n=1 Tax=Nitratireductor kimnyeongensis TaxID=430679 RepID=A0ABW0T6G7_9HYPH|nr:hypothetical protein [Nitratireductor kimnyeongensis]QZZ34534.1 hypothetical protein KW403_12070 [Nitratireductor kimnyeongensis]